jgi:hypothetical protein
VESWEKKSSVYSERLMSFGGHEYDEYKFIIDTSNRYAQQAVLKILYYLLDNKGVKVEPWSNNNRDISDFVITDDNGKRILYVFKPFGINYTLDRNEFAFRLKNRKAEDYFYVSYVWTQAYSEILDHNHDENDCTRGTKRLSIKDFFDIFIGSDEYERFYENIKEFEEKVRNYIGLRVVKTLQPSTLYRFKRIVNNSLIKFDYEKHIGDSIEPDQIALIKKQYIDKKVYTSMINSEDFSESFITAEWLYDTYKNSGKIDYTIVVLGYFKSIEQMLYSYIKLHAGEGYKLKRNYLKDDDKYTYEKDGEIKLAAFVPINQENIDEDRLNTTLDTMLKGFFFRNEDLVRSRIDRDKTFPYIKSVMDLVKEKRNGNFHKHNISEEDAEKKVEEARDLTFLTSFLVLGSYVLRNNKTNNDYEKLGVLLDGKSEYQKLCEYLNDHPSRVYYLGDDDVKPYKMWSYARYSKEGNCTFENLSAHTLIQEEPYDLDPDNLPVIKAGWLDVTINPTIDGPHFTGPMFTVFEDNRLCAQDVEEIPLY